jgi:hypothetical protein
VELDVLELHVVGVAQRATGLGRAELVLTRRQTVDLGYDLGIVHERSSY